MEQTILKGTKLNMTQIFMDNGKVVPVTVVALESAEGLDNADNFLNKEVVLVGKSKGKGFTGVIKKWNFRRQPETRGASNKVRSSGAIGAQTPGRVFLGKKMAGKHGNKKVTLKGIKIVQVDAVNSKVMVTGPIPGARNAKVTLKVQN